MTELLNFADGKVHCSVDGMTDLYNLPQTVQGYDEIVSDRISRDLVRVCAIVIAINGTILGEIGFLDMGYRKGSLRVSHMSRQTYVSRRT